jgi:hypothetical protein
MRTLVCFGHRDMGEIEVSTADIMPDNLIMSRESFPPVVYEEAEGQGSRDPSCPKEEIRLFHSQLWLDIGDDDDDEYLRFDCEADIASEHDNEDPLFRDNPAAAPQRKPSRLPRNDVLAVIDDMERVLNNEIDSRSSTLISYPGMMQSNMTRFLCPQSMLDNEGVLNLQPEQSLDPVLVKSSSETKTRISSHTGSGAAWKRLFPIERLRKKKKASDTLLLIPNNFKDSAEDFGDAKTQAKAAAARRTRRNPRRNPSRRNRFFAMIGSRTTQQCKKGPFLHRLLPCGRSFSSKNDPRDDTVQDLGLDVQKDKTLSMSSGDDDHDCEAVTDKVDSDFRPHPTFRNDDELIDHLVKVSALNASLEIEKGLTWLQERIRSRSSSISTASNSTKASAESLHRIFSPCFLDPPSLVTPSPEHSVDEDDDATSAAPSVENDAGSTSQLASIEEGYDSTSPSSSFDADDGSTDQNESTPSLSSFEDFFSCVNDVDYSAASLEALMIEQDLEKLSSQELTLLLDAELDKLMREGLV